MQKFFNLLNIYINFLRHYFASKSGKATIVPSAAAAANTLFENYSFDCGKPSIAPNLNLSIGEISDARWGSWSWMVNVCNIYEFGELDCTSNVGVVVGNANKFLLFWVLSMLETGVKAEDLIVISNIFRYNDTTNPRIARYHTVKRIHRIANVTPPFDFPVPTLLELSQPIVMDANKTMTPICVPKYIGDQTEEMRRFNHTSVFVAGWSLDNDGQVRDPMRQFHTELFFTVPENYSVTYLPDNEKFIVGSPMLQLRENNRWHIYGGLYLYNDLFSMMMFDQMDIMCNWIETITKKEVICV